MAERLAGPSTDVAVDVLEALVSSGDEGPVLSLVPTGAADWAAAFDEIVGLFRTLQAALESHRGAGSRPSSPSRR